MTRQTQIKKSLALGTPYVWLTSGAVAFCMILVIGVIGLITVRGAVHFWPKPIVMLNMTAEVSEERVMGEIAGTEVVSASLLKEQGIMVPDGLNSIKRLLIKTGNRKLNGVDFKWFNETDYIAGIEIPSNATVVEREEWGNFYGFINSIKENGQVIKPKTSLLDELDKRLTRRHLLVEEIRAIENSDMQKLNGKVERLRLESRRLELKESQKTARVNCLSRLN